MAANVHGEVVGEGRTKDLKNLKSILRTTEPRLGLKGEGWTIMGLNLHSKKRKFNLVLFSFAFLLSIILLTNFIINFSLVGIFFSFGVIILCILAILELIEYLPKDKNKTKSQFVYINAAVAGAFSFWISPIITAMIYRSEESIKILVLIIVFLLCFLVLLAFFILVDYLHGWGELPTHCEHCGEKLISQGAKVCPNCQKRIRRPRVWSDD